jgi:hypothetical protein
MAENKLGVSFDRDDNDIGKNDNDVELESNDIQEEQDDFEDEVAEVEDEQPAGSESASEGSHEEKGAARSKVEERFGELTRKRKEAEKLAQDRLDELNKIQSQMLQKQEPVIPELPDPDMVSEEAFRQAIQARDKAITDRVNWQQQVQTQENTRQYMEQQTQVQKAQELQTVAQTYATRAEKLGISKDELAKAGQVVSQVGLDDSIVMHILKDENGAAITKYLATNVEDLLEIAHSDPITAALYIERKVKPKLNPRKRKSNAPPPNTRLKGGSPNSKDRFPLTGGAKFE